MSRARTSLDSLFAPIINRPSPAEHDHDEQDSSASPSIESSITHISSHKSSFSRVLKKDAPFLHWQSQPQRLHRDGFVTKLTGLGDAATILISCIFFVHGVFVLRYSGVGVKYIENLRLLEDAAKYGPTLFPILFAAIVGQAMHAIALSRLECGERLQVLDQLLGSTTIFATVVTQLKYQRMGALGVLLIFLWALSPLGGQASLRIVEFDFRTTSKQATLLYLDPELSQFLPSNIAQYTVDSLLTEMVLHGLVHSALMAPVEIKNSTMDTWGNLKIPFLEAASKTGSPDDQGWYQLMPDNTVASSLVGLPMSSLGRTSNATFKLETQYMYLDCIISRPYSTLDPWPGQQQLSEETDLTYRNNSCVYIGSNLKNQTLEEQGARQNSSDPNLTPRVVRYQGINDDWYTSAASCDVRTSYVELDVSCVGRNCTSNRIRESIQAHHPAGWTIFDRRLGAEVEYLDAMFNFMMCNLYYFQPTFAQRYLTRPMAPYNGTIDENMHLENLTDETFSWRWSQIWNTFQIAGMGLTSLPNKLPGNIPGGEDAGNVIPGGMAVHSTRVNITDGEVVLVCNTGWLTLLLVATSIMFLVGVWGMVLDHTRKSPDIAMNISSMTRDNPFVNTSPGGTTMHGAERMRKLRNVRVRIGDICPMEDVGYIAISTYGDEQFVDTLHDDRVYA